MARTRSNLGFTSLVALGLMVPSLARAQDAPVDPEPSEEPAAAPADAEAAPAEGAAAGSGAGEADAVADAQAGNSPVELPGKTYRFVGARYRGIVMPKFMQNLFAEGGRTVFIHGFGPEFAIRKNGFEYNLSAWLAFYSLEDTAFRGKTDPVQAWELVRSDLKLLYLTSDFLWSHEFSPEFSLNYGVGAGFGIVFGDLFRVQSYPEFSGQNPDKYAKCTNIDQPPQSLVDGIRYCDDDNHHFGNYKESSWANGGSKPLLFPWLTLQTGFRFKPSRSFAGRVDLGFGTSGFFFGFGADYGL